MTKKRYYLAAHEHLFTSNKTPEHQTKHRTGPVCIRRKWQEIGFHFSTRESTERKKVYNLVTSHHNSEATPPGSNQHTRKMCVLKALPLGLTNLTECFNAGRIWLPGHSAETCILKANQFNSIGYVARSDLSKRQEIATKSKDGSMSF